MSKSDLIQVSIWEFERLLRKSKAKNITEKTRASILQKIDDIEKFINDNAGSFCFDNRLLRNTERFSSVFIATGGSEADAADCIFAFYILPALRRTRPDFDAWKEKFADILIQKFSGISTMARSKKFLKK